MREQFDKVDETHMIGSKASPEDKTRI
jgi:hypothetical protein